MTCTTTSVPMRLVDSHGSVLTGRPLAGEIAGELARHVADHGHVVVDFAGIEAMSPSFADELFGKLWSSVGDDDVALENVDEHIASVARMMKRNRARD